MKGGPERASSEIPTPRLSGFAPSINQKLDFGFVVKDELATKQRFGLNQGRRAEHIAILGKTGSGKSFLLSHMASQDISSNHGFVYFDLHGDATPFLLQLLAAREQREQVDLSEKVIVIQPADPLYAVGLNVLEAKDTRHTYWPGYSGCH